MRTTTSIYPELPDDIDVRVWESTTHGIYVALDFGPDVEVVALTDLPGRMHPQVLSARLRELANEIDRKCDAIRDEQAHVGQLVEAKAAG